MKVPKHILPIFTFICFLFGCEEVFFEENISEESISIFAPQDGVSTDNNSVTFTWSTVENAESYEVQIVQPDFQNTVTIIETTNVETNEHTTDLEIGEYAWRVKAINSNSETMYTTASLTITENENFSERNVSLTSPEDGFASNASSIILEWQAISDTSLYRIELLDANDTILDTQTTTVTSVTITATTDLSKWQVRAENDDEVTNYTTHNIIIDTEAPNAPTLTAPANNSIVSVINTFEWTREELEGSTEKDILYIYEDVALSNLVLEQEATTGIEITLEAGTFYWIVKSFDAAGNESDTSETFTFTVN